MPYLFRLISIALTCLALLFGTALQADSSTTAKSFHILVLNSYNKGYTWTDNEVNAIEEAFNQNTQIILHIEYMDTKVLNTPDYFDLLKQLYAHKYEGKTIDIVIATDDDALRFLRRYQHELFPDAPTVFAGINNFQPQKIAGLDNITGVNEQADFDANLKLILDLQPDVNELYVIADQLTAGKLILKEFQSSAARFQDQLQFHYLTDLTINEIEAKVAKLPKSAAIFYLTFFRDASGTSFSPWESIPRISQNASVPLYGQVDYMLGKGILGGRLKSSYYQGQVAAQLTQRIIKGESASAIPVVMDSPNYFMFDYTQLSRFDIKFSQLPADSIVINEPETFYYKYKTLIWTVVSIIVVLVLFILVLLFNISKRKRAQKGLQDIISTMSSILEQGSLGKIREALVDVIHQVIFLNKKINRVAFFNYQGAMKQFQPEHLSRLFDEGETTSDDASQQLIRNSIEREGCSVRGQECVALFKSTTIQGNVIYLKGQRRFDDMDRDLLDILTNNVSMAMEALEKNKIQESLETARKIQLSMLPHNFNSVADGFGVELHAHLIPAKEVGGDFYDFFAIDDEHMGFVVADVSGKGVPAALFMAMAKTLIRSNSVPKTEPHQILYRVNNELARDNDQCMFVTLFFGIFNRSTGAVRFANGGHNPPCQIDAEGSVSWLTPTPSVPLGVMADMDYETETMTLNPGEALFLYTDGVTEAMDIDATLFGNQRLEQTLAEKPNLTAVGITEQVIDRVNHFAEGAGQADDITVLLLRNSNVHDSKQPSQ